MPPEPNQNQGEDLSQRSRFHGIVGAHPTMRRLYERIEAVASTSTTVLIVGETGTGKELVARAIHECGAAPRAPFVAVNCAALPRELMESELFGYKRGAFSGAEGEYIGLFRAAQGGTLLLDEITEMSPDTQSKLLRVSQERTVRPVGSVQEIPVNVRIIASTNQRPEEAVRLGRLREDLYYRLQVNLLEVPPLRERLSDLPLLVEHFIALFNEKFERATPVVEIEPEALAALQRYKWPGNVRELSNAIETGFTFSPSPMLGIADLPANIRGGAGAGTTELADGLDSDERERATIAQEFARREHLPLNQGELAKLWRVRGKSGVNNYLGDHPNVRKFLEHEGILRPQAHAGPTEAEQPLITDSRINGADPLVISCKDLDQEPLPEMYPNPTFKILLLRGNREETVRVRRSPDRRPKFKLEVDLSDRQLGIYNNDGKRFLRDKYRLRDKAVMHGLLQAAARFHAFLMGTPQNVDANRSELGWAELIQAVNPALPLRWASAGVLPIAVDRDNRQWVVLFFRDINPVGWNVANGASEKAAEWSNLSMLLSRESSEELIITIGKPFPNGSATQYTLVDPISAAAVSPDLCPKDIQGFMKAHHDLRQSHDKVDLSFGGWGAEKSLESVVTDFSVAVKPKDATCGSVIFSVNPLECGIEVIRLSSFELEHGDWIMDGEISPAPGIPGEMLLRRPVILLSVDFLKGQFQARAGSFGAPIRDAGNGFNEYDAENCPEGKRLDEIPKDAFRLFIDFNEEYGIDLRNWRLKQISEKLASTATSESECKALENEKSQIATWLNGRDSAERREGKPAFGKLFEGVKKTGNIPAGLLTTLCPVTWKTLELAFRYGYLPLKRVAEDAIITGR